LLNVVGDLVQPARLLRVGGLASKSPTLDDLILKVGEHPDILEPASGIFRLERFGSVATHALRVLCPLAAAT